MAVIEIAKIQVRRGQENQTGVPQLAGGEFAWAADTEKLYIGLRRDDGGSRDQNVEILTENHLRNLFNLGLSELNYTYREYSTSTVVAASGITAEDESNDEVIRTIQDKLDDFVSCKDFGVVGDGNPWEWRSLQLAIDRLYFNTGGYEPHPAKKLYFPAGTYVITQTVNIPARTTIIGDGPGKTIFVFAPTPETTSTAMFQTCSEFEIEGEIRFYRTFDTGDGSGADFSTTSSARNIHIEDVTMRYDPIATTVTEALSLLKLDCADNSVVKNVEFLGNLDETTVNITTSSYVGLTIRGKTANGTNENSIIDNCVFNNLYHGVLSNDDISRTVISNSEFSHLVRGITFNDPVSGTVGPRLVKIEHNTFDMIEEQAIYVGSNGSLTGSFVTSQNNFFNRVGNYSLTDPDQLGDFATTATAIISFLSDGNSSFNDHFNRYHVQNALNNTPEASTTTFVTLVEGRTSLDMLHVTTATIAGGDSLSFLRIPITQNPQHLSVKYHAFKSQANGSTSTTAERSASSTATISVDYVPNIWPGSVCSGLGIAPGSIVQTVGRQLRTDRLEIRLDQPVTTLEIGTPLNFTILRSLDKMGDLRVYLQQGIEPEYIIVDDYNYITEWGDYSGGISFSTAVNSEYQYYELIATVDGDVIGDVTIEFQTKLMI
jgi:hypothetical protein